MIQCTTKQARAVPSDADDRVSIRSAGRHLEADWRNAVIVDGRRVHAVGWVDGAFDDRLVHDGTVTEHRRLSSLVKSWA